MGGIKKSRRGIKNKRPIKINAGHESTSSLGQRLDTSQTSFCFLFPRVKKVFVQSLHSHFFTLPCPRMFHQDFTVVVALVVEQLLPAQEIHGSYLNSGTILSAKCTFK